MNIVNEQDWAELGNLYQRNAPFPAICIDGFLDSVFAKQLSDSYPDISQARVIGKEFSTVNERLKVQITDPSQFPQPVAALSEVLGSQDFLNKLSTITGIPNLIWDPGFTGGGMHLTGSTGILDVHVDFNFEKKLGLYRRLNILIYLNPEWDEKWGGAIELWDKTVENCEQSYFPILNRCLLFNTSDYSFHGVTQVTCPKGITRNSFAAYYYTEEPGDNAGMVYGGNHSTIFKARPDELSKKFLSMPLEKLHQSFSKCKNTLKKTFTKQKGTINSGD